MIARRPTRADVAALAGTSVAVVSYVVNDGPRPVAAATRARVLEAIETLGYRPDAVARALAGGASRTIGLVVPDVSNRFFAELAHAVGEHALAAGRLILLADSADDAGREQRALRELVQRRVDAVLLASVDADPDLSDVAAAGVPVVLLDRAAAAGTDVSSVSVDHRAGARLATEHLLGHGRRTVGAVHGPTRVPTAALRAAGWRDALDAAGLPLGPSVEAPFTLRGGREAGLELLGPDGPDAVFTASDEQAAGLLRAAHDLGLRVPEDVAVVAFDGTQTAVHTIPSLTVVAQPLDVVARHAVEAATRTTGGPARLVVEPALTRRASCGCPGSDGRP